MAANAYTHVAFADESNWNQGRFRSISLVSAALPDARTFHTELDSIRAAHGKSEFKWSDRLKKAHGIALADFYFQRHAKMRVDVLIWDTEDSRHKVSGRDDKANFARLYYHLLHNVLKRRWLDGARWLICPDQQKEVDWETLEQCLEWKGWAIEENLLTKSGLIPNLRDYYCIHEFRCACSKEYLLIQLADMFAGLGAYSYESIKKYRHWVESNNKPKLFDLEPSIKLSGNDKERLPILHHVRTQAGKRKFQISLDSSGGLCSKDPKNPLNFWLYTPQSRHDKAPVKNTLPAT